MKRKPDNIDRDYLRRVKASTTEQRLDWLAAAQEFVQAARLGREKKGKMKE